ncbi:MAG: hypothetical protein NAOJABEB_02999 [Steroidobacteraceae bacterium]|nr:hypothetical protein [Steroidobacteraceae bacterium]
MADLDARAVHAHRVAQPLLDLALVLLRLHVDEVDDDEPAEVADAQLAGDLVGRLEVGVECGGLDVAAARRACGVDVDRDERLRVVDDEAAAGRELHLVRIGRLDLALDLVAREERNVVGVELELPLHVGRHRALHVFLGGRECGRLVDEAFADVVPEIVAQCARHRVALAIDEERGRAALDRRGNLRPLLDQVVEVPLQFFDRAADTGRAHDGAHVLRDLERIHGLAHLVAVLALDPARHTAGPRVVRHQHEVAAGEADESGECGALVAALLFFDLDHDFLAFGQELADVHAPALGRLPEVLLRNFFQRQEAVTLGPVVDEARLERLLDARDATLVDVRLLLFLGRQLDRQVVEFLTVNQCDSQLFLLSCVDQHSFHWPLLWMRGPTGGRRKMNRTRGFREAGIAARVIDRPFVA